MTAQHLDGFVSQGVQRYRQGSHSTVDELWNLSTFTDLVQHLEKGCTTQGYVTRREDLIKSFQACVDYAIDSDRLAIVLIKSGEAVLCFTDIRNGQSWYLFDSHGQSHEGTKLAYWKEFPSVDRLLDAFLQKYPPQDFGDSSFQADMYNLFEAIPIVRRRMAVMPEAASAHASGRVPTEVGVFEDAIDYRDCAKISCLAEVSSSEAFAKITTPEVSTPAASGLKPPPPSSSPHLPPDLFDRSNYECAISFEIMADPVVCSDGMTYERPQIEKHFEARVAQEEARMAEEESRARGETKDEEDTDSSDCRCGADRPPIELTSPITGDRVTGILYPNHQVEQQIVRLVESNAFMMTDEQTNDWRQRRAEKQKRDIERRKEELRAQEYQEEMRRNASEAEQRRLDEQQQNPLPEETALQVRVDRDTNDESDCLGEDDLGISVALAEKRNRVPAGYVSQGSRAPRCMVACCAVALISNQWCARCARLACDDCLGFGVTSIEKNHHTPSDLSRVCFECVSQIVDAMESAPRNILVRQKRAVLIGTLERHLALLSSRAATKQDDVVRHEVHDGFSARMEEVENTIRHLESRLQSLNEQVRQEESRAAAAATDEGSTEISCEGGELAELRRHRESLEKEYTETLREEEPTDEDERLQLAVRRSDLSHRLEVARTNLACAESSAHSGSGLVDESTMPVTDIQQDLVRLQERLQTVSNGNDGETEEEQIARATEMSDICSRIEELSTRLAMETSLGNSDPQAPSPQTSVTRQYPALRSVLSELEGHVRRTRQRGLFGSKRKAKELSNRITDLRTRYSVLTQSSAADLSRSKSGVKRLLVSIDRQDVSLPTTIRENLRDALREVSQPQQSSPSASDADDDSLNRHIPEPAASSADEAVEEDMVVEFVRLSSVDVSGLTFEAELAHAQRLSELDAILQAAEAELFQNQQEELPSTALAVEARQDLSAIGGRLTAWPLPLGLEYPTPRMERQLEALRNTLELRLVESKRSAEAHITEQYDALVSRRDELEDGIAEARRRLEGAAAHARQEEERRRERAERRRQEEEARRVREQQLHQEAQRARQAAEELRRQHMAAEAATTEAFANARVEGGARLLGGIGDLRMCRRCRAGPIENRACADLDAHNNKSTDYKGSTVASVRRPNACPHCNWFTSDWRNWPYWDGIYGPH